MPDLRLSPLTLLILLATAAIPVHGEPDPGLLDFFAREVEPSGPWRQDNADDDGKPESVRYWLSHNTWGPGGHSMITTVDAVYGDGHCEAVAHLVHFADHADGQVHSMSLTAAGIVFRSVVERGENGELIRIARGTAPNGVEIIFRDRSGFEDDDTRWSQGESPDGDNWKPRDRILWHRTEDAPDCSSGPGLGTTGD